MNKYKSFTAKGITFLFATEKNPVTKEFDYHIWLRHLIMPTEAIKAFFSADECVYNPQYDRYEAYSGLYNITIYYFYPDKSKENLVIVISAFIE
jgi:hypothetical protein